MATNPIQVINPGPSAGQAFGKGLVDTLQPYLQREQQRYQTQRAISDIKSRSVGASPTEQLYNLIEASSISPEIGRNMGPLYDSLIRAQQSERFFGGNGQQTGPRDQDARQNIAPGYQPKNNEQPNISLKIDKPGIPSTFEGQGEPIAGQPRPGAPSTSGILPRIIPTEEIQALAQRAAANQNDPSALPYWQQFYNNQNEIARNARAEAANAAANMGVMPDEMAEFMKIGEKYGNEQDINKWAIDTNREFKEYKNNKNKLVNADIPGLVRGMIRGPGPRNQAIKNMTGSVQDLIKSGHEPFVRQKLAEQDLSPTEIEEVIHPLSDNTFQALEKMPKGTFPAERGVDYKNGKPTISENDFVDYDTAKETAPKEIKAMQNRLSNFFKNNVDNDTSLLVLRHKLWDQKDYDWRQIGPAVREAMSKGLKLTPSQLTELTELETQPPRQSISDVFNNWGRWIDYIKGAK